MKSVNHPQFGKGQVISQDAQKIVVDFNGTTKTLAAKFSKLTNEDGTPFGEQYTATVKAAPSAKEKVPPTQEDNIQSWKRILLSVNDKWNRNNTYKLAEQNIGKIKANGNNFIESLLSSFDNGKLSEKQAYHLAKYAVENDYLN